ncbi:hypothetical protein WDJ51_12730 [Rathayibacter sp. YIM 133350]|uniref:hypothetical protein n=1 Tax=Rathayibacter sp. YIM 133350 TaxID=3131992 RepID=UPI00307CDF64
MSDFARHLPLSQRGRQDESGVSAHWGHDMARMLDALGARLAEGDDDAWQAASLRTGCTVHESVAYLVTRLSTSRRQRLGSISLGLLENLFSLRATEAGIARRAGAALSRTDLLEQLRSLATAAGAGTGHAGIRELETVVVGTLDVSIPLGLDVPIPPAASGAVALRRALTAPTEIKAVVRGRSLAATDAGWSFGHGPELVDTAAGLLLFLYGRSNTAPHPRTEAERPPSDAH